MKQLLLLIGFFCFFGELSSQFYKKHEDNKLKFYGTFDFRSTPMETEVFQYYGIKLGVGNKSIRFGGSYHIFHKDIFSIFHNNFFKLPTPVYYQTKFRVISLFTEVIVHQTPRWELIVPIHIGTGKMNLNANINDKLFIRAPDLGYTIKEEWVESAVVSLKANYRVVKWAGLTAGFGYNRAFSSDKYIRTIYSGMFFSFGGKLYFNEIGKLFKSKEYRKKYFFDPNFVKKYEQTTN